MPEESSLIRKDLLEILVAHLQEFAVILMDPNGTFMSWHPGIEKQLGYTADEFIGRNGDILILPADRMEGAFHRELHTAAETGRASDRSWLVRNDGRHIFANGVCVPLRAPQTGEILGFGKVLQDITENKNAEDDLRALARTIDQSVVFIRTWSGVIEHWTSGCQRLYGWSSQDAVGRLADDLLQTIYPVPYEIIQRELLAKGAWQGELQQKKRDGTPAYVSTHCIAFTDGGDEPVSVISTHTDITPRLRMQRELERANDQLKSMALELERSNEELEEFARIASHDLGAPITSARWLVDLLTTRHAKNLDLEGQKCLAQVSLGLERMANLIEAVLAHALVGKTAIVASEMADSEGALAIALGNLQKDLELSGATITRDPLPNLLLQEQPLVQLFQNLLSNAIKYRRLDVPLCIRLTAVSEGALQVIGVHDNGSGIEPDWFERIFQPLQRRHGNNIAGSGIGLATCKKIVARAGGEIWVDSQPGSGSSFYFKVPGSPK